MWRVGETKYSIEELTDGQRTALFRKWREEKTYPECLCNETNGKYPQLGFRLTASRTIVPVNLPRNTRGGLHHAASCQYNRVYTDYLKTKGITLNEENELHCKLKVRKKERKQPQAAEKPLTSRISSKNESAVTHRKAYSSLRYFFFAMLQKYNIHIYDPHGSRNIYGRLYRACHESFIDGENVSSFVYIVNTKVRYNFRKHRFLIGWGSRSTITAREKHIHIPLAPLGSRSTASMEYKVPPWIFQQATFTEAAVDTGYFLIWREQSHDRDGNPVIRDVELVFVPADPATGIPIDSSLELTMLQYLLKRGVTFEKPLLTAEDDDIRPDFIVKGDKQDTIIEVAGLLHNKEYRIKLRKKEQVYKARGLRYVEWDGKQPLPHLDL